MRGIDGQKAIFNQDLALAANGDRLRHQRKVLGLRRPRHEPDQSIFTRAMSDLIIGTLVYDIAIR